MKTILENLVFVGAFIQIIALVPYGLEVIRGTTKPNRISWLLWSIAPMIGAIAAFSKGVGWAALPVFMSGFSPLIIFLLTIFNKKSYWELKTFDYYCGGASVIALVLWAITKDANIAIVFAIISDGLAAAPTLIKSWTHPESETPVAYLISLLAVLTTFAAITTKDFTSLAFPIYLTFINSSLWLTPTISKFGKRHPHSGNII